MGREKKVPVGKIDKSTLDRLNQVEYQIIKIRLADTDVNRDLYQRALSNRYLQYAEDWCNLIAQPLVVVSDPARPGKYLILDGQHTAKAAITKFGEDHQLYAKVIDPVSDEDQALLFVQLNQERKGLSAQQLHKARVSAKSDQSLTINKLADRYNLVLGRENKKAGQDNWTVVTAVNGIYTIANTFGAEVLDKILYIITQAWAADSKNFNHQFMIGLAKLLTSRSDINIEKVVSILSKFDNQTGVSSKAERFEREAGSDAKINAIQYLRTLEKLYEAA